MILNNSAIIVKGNGSDTMILTLNNNSTINLNKPILINELIKLESNFEDIVGAIYNGKVLDLNSTITQDGNLEWIKKSSRIGSLILERTLSFLFITAVKHCFIDAKVIIRHTLSSGLYIEIQKEAPLTPIEINLIKKKINEMIAAKTPIYRKIVSKEEAIHHFMSLKMEDKASLLKYRKSQYSSIYTCMDVDDYFYGIMAPHAGMIDQFTLNPYHQGVWLSLNQSFIDQPKLFQIFKRFEERGQKIGITNAWQLNQAFIDGKQQVLIDINEKRIEDDLNEFVDIILKQPKIKVILIAGPSSAGKTTTSKRICEKLEKAGHPSLTLAMDDFFLNRVDSPRLEDGSYDYENIDCIDLKLFNDTIDSLLSMKPTLLPTYNFALGEKTWNTDPVTISNNHILIIEGIHALNPKSSQFIENHKKFKLYINALTHLNYDDHNRISTTDYRLIRRMTRDYQFRGRSITGSGGPVLGQEARR